MKSPSRQQLVALGVFVVSLIGVLAMTAPSAPRPIRFLLSLSEQPPGTTGPLITTGEPSAGDFLYVIWTAAREVVICYNSWGNSEVLKSAPVGIDPEKPLGMSVMMPSLNASPEGGQLQVVCDGVTLLEGKTQYYPSNMRRASLGVSRFGAVLCGESLPGKILNRNGRPKTGDLTNLLTPFEDLVGRLENGRWSVFGVVGLVIVFYNALKPGPLFGEILESGERWWRRLCRWRQRALRIQPLPFSAGVILAFLGMAWGGKRVSESAYIETFHRFYPQISPESYFFPSSSLLESLAEHHLSTDQILVVIGGSSILNGVGQPVEQLWSRVLQEKLGPEYQVINVALRGGHPTDAGQVLAEIMRKKGRRVIYVSDFIVGPGYDPDGAVPYRYIFWDAWFKGLLLDNPARQDRLSGRIMNETTGEQLFETQLAMWLNSRFYSIDLWNFMTYQHGGSVWTSLVIPFYEPRRLTVDPEIEIAPEVESSLDHNDGDLGRLRAMVARLEEIDSKQISGNEGNGELLQSPANILEAMRPSTILIPRGVSPLYVGLLKASEREQLWKSYATNLKALRQSGFHCLDPNHFLEASDYADMYHLQPSGGRKLAVEVAEKIRKLRTSGMEKL